MYAATACPGPYLLGKMEYIANEANKLNEETKPEPKPEQPTSGYLVKINTDCLNIREKAGTDSDVVGQITDRGVYTIVAESSGQGAKNWGKLKSGAGWISLDYVKKMYEVLTKTNESARNAIAFLKKNKSGRATFLPIDTITCIIGDSHCVF